MTIAELFAKLAEHAQTEDGRKAVIDGLHSTMQPVYQAIYDKGHGQATKDAKPKITELEGKVTEAEEKVSAAEAKVEELSKAKPEIEQIRAQHRLDIEKEKTEARKREEALAGKLTQERNARVQSDLRALLTGKVVDDYIPVAAFNFANRIRHRDDGSLFVLQDGTEVEIQVPQGKAPLDLLAEEIVTKAPDMLKLSKADAGAGVTSTATGGTGAYDPEKAGKEMAKAQTEASAATKDLAFR